MEQNKNPFSTNSTVDHAVQLKPVQQKLNHAFLFGATPLIVGLAIYVCWRFTAWPWLMLAGAVTFFTGIIFFFLGLGALRKARSRRLELSDNDRGRGRLSGMTGLALVVLLANWPVAFCLISDAAGTGQSTAVTIQNMTAESLTDVSFSWASTKGDFGTIDAGSTVKNNCRVSLFHSSMIYINYTSGELKSEIRATPMRPDTRLPTVTVIIGDNGTIDSHELGNIQHQLTKHINIDTDGLDQLIFHYGQIDSNSVEVERLINGQSKWHEITDMLGESYDMYIQDARISIDGDEFHLYGEGQAGKFHERRKLENGELLERSEDLVDAKEQD